MFTYESCVIANPRLDEEETEALIGKLEGVLESNGAQNIVISRWGLRKLAYPIKKSAEGFYFLLFFDHPKAAETLTALDGACKYDENVFRIITIKVPKKKKGHDIKPIIPEPGYLKDFSMELRALVARRRRQSMDRGLRGPDSRPSPPPAPRTETPAGATEPKAAEKTETPEPKAAEKAEAPEPKATEKAEATEPKAAEKNEAPEPKATEKAEASGGTE